jgi:CPA2 family monovalent cation:H+ antiporter-2
MQTHDIGGGYKDVVLFLATAGVVAPLFRRARISPILGFLGAGVALGPYGLGALADQAPWLRFFTISRSDELAQVAEFGVVFLLFMIGLELSWERLRLLRRYVFGLGGLQVALSLAVMTAAATALGLSPTAAVAVGAALSLSSTAVVMQLLTEHRRQHSVAGRATFSVLLFQDLAAPLILVTLALIARGGTAKLSVGLLLAFGPAVLGVGLLLAFGRLLLRPMLRSVARAKSDEMFMAACLLVVVGSGLVSALAGLSMALGAFIAGLLLAETEYRHEVEVQIEPFKGLLLALFFVAVGARLDLSVLADRPLLVLGVAAGAIAVKALVAYGLAPLFRLTRAQGAETALLIAGGGEFAYVIDSAAMDEHLVDPATGQAVLVVATLSMICIPLLAALGLRLGGRRLIGAGLPPEPPAPTVHDEAPHVLVVGYGRVGRLVGEMLGRHDVPWVAAERDPKLVEAARHAGERVFFGDASRPELLKRCGLERAPALVVTMDSPEGVEAVVGAARAMRPELTIVARARDARQAQRLYELGATDAVPETVEASLQLSEAVLVDIGVPMGLVIASIHERRDEFRKALNRPEALGGRARRFRRSAEG